MLADIVIDVNVFMHASDPRQAHQKVAENLIRKLRECATHLCIDEGFDIDESKNRSAIGAEYLKHLRTGSLAFALVVHLGSNERIKIVSRKVPQAIAKKITQQVGKGPDRTYLRVAYNSKARTLSSHDFGDLPDTVRRRLGKAIKVSILDVTSALAALS